MVPADCHRAGPARHNVVQWLVAAVADPQCGGYRPGDYAGSRQATVPAAGTTSHALNGLWSQLLNDKGPTTIIVPDHTYAMLQESAGEREELQNYLNRQTPGDNTGARKLHGPVSALP